MSHPPPCRLQAAKGEVAVAVGELMEAAGMADVLPLPKARVPVVKFVVPKTGTKVGAATRPTDLRSRAGVACCICRVLGQAGTPSSDSGGAQLHSRRQLCACR